MRTIQISTDVFQAIWAARERGEETEDAILARVLNVEAHATPEPQQTGKGFTDQRYGVHFPEGFELFRTYLGKEYRARVVDGAWHLNGKRVGARSINELSAAIGTKNENGWVNWNYGYGGDVQKIASLRDPTKVRRRAML